jgi:glycosyltransferase involved in cell wall biosynthesis
MSRGKAVIGTHPGGHEDMITDGEDGLLIPAGDSEALRAAITRLVEDEGLRRRLGEAARARADEFVASVSVPRLEAFLEEVVGSRR